jgi:hypothetical protein
MKEQRGLYRIKIMCRALKVSRSGYYAWRKRMPSKSEIANNKLLESIRDIYRKNRKVYGSPRITDELNDYGMRCGENRVARLMKENGIRAHVRKKFKRTTDSRHKFQASENLLIQGNKSVDVCISNYGYSIKADHRVIDKKPVNAGIDYRCTAAGSEKEETREGANSPF